MSEKERLVSFTLLGQNHAFYTGAPEEEMNRILALVRELVEGGTERTSGTIPVSKAAIMDCLNIASRYIRLQQEYDEYRKENDARMADLIEKIGAALPAEK